MIIVDEAQVRRSVTPGGCVEMMRQALSGLEKGAYTMPQRVICSMPNGAAFGFMPAYIDNAFGAKVLTAYGPNAGTKYPTHIGYVMLFEAEHCTVTGLVDATAVTEIRTGAVSAVATDLLARRDAHTLALVGAGAQARSHVAAITTVRNITSITVCSLHRTSAETFAREVRAQYGIPVTVCGTPAEAVREADIICTLTPSKEPLLTKDMVRPGTHINAVGTFTPTTREVSGDLVAASRLYADQVSAMKSESGEYLIPLGEGLITEEHIVGSIGQVLNGTAPGRQDDEEITLFDALGLAVEDIACAQYALERANAEK